MTFALGNKSLANMTGLHPVAIQTIKLAITLSAVDFGITEPQVRTLEYQKKLVARGVSRTLKSNHIQRPDRTGKTTNLYGHACDLVPWINGKFDWDWNAIYQIAAAMAEAGRQLGIVDKMCWGAVWDRWVSQYMGDAAAMKAAHLDYVRRHGPHSMQDGPHWQWFVQG